jgi:hypothetical protein
MKDSNAKDIRRQPFTHENIEQQENRSGVYTLWDRQGRFLYTGSSDRVKDRLNDWFFGRGELRQVPGKAELREKVAKFDVTYQPIGQARDNETRLKESAPGNKL